MVYWNMIYVGLRRCVYTLDIWRWKGQSIHDCQVRIKL